MSTSRKTGETGADATTPAGNVTPKTPSSDAAKPAPQADHVPESGGRGGLDPTRYGDWEKNGRCVDF